MDFAGIEPTNESPLDWQPTLGSIVSFVLLLIDARSVVSAPKSLTAAT
eukprot:COSAG02_NODE_50722_length_318_cov_1.420091_1_plen_47_part_01